MSIGYTPRDGYGVWAHGVAVALHGVEYGRMEAYLSDVYGQPLSELTDGIEIFRVDAHWMIGFAMRADEQSQFDATLPERTERLTAALVKLG